MKYEFIKLIAEMIPIVFFMIFIKIVLDDSFSKMSTEDLERIVVFLSFVSVVIEIFFNLLAQFNSS